jgi:hypothetical protein
MNQWLNSVFPPFRESQVLTYGRYAARSVPNPEKRAIAQSGPKTTIMLFGAMHYAKSQVGWWNALANIRGSIVRIAGALIGGTWKVLKPASRQVAMWPFAAGKTLGPVWRAVLILAFALFCFFYGAAFALLAPYFAVPLVGLLVPLALLVVWTLPDMHTAPIRLLEILFFSFFIIMVMWPNYLAIALPGLPWITLLRLVAVPVTAVLLICLSVSGTIRANLSSILAAAPWVRNFFLLFLIVQTASIAFSGDAGFSINKFIVAQTNWTAIFFSACLIFAKDRRAEQMAALLCVMAVALGFLALWEFRLGRPPWVDHIPSFLKIEDPSVLQTLRGASRYEAHRVQTTFSTPLELGEYLAITFPFVLHFGVNAYKPWIRIAAFLAIPVIVFTAMVCQSRSAFVGFFIAGVTYPLLWAAHYGRRNRQNLLANAIPYLTPMLVAPAFIALFFVNGIRYRVLGGGETEFSNQGRVDQLHMGIRQITTHPWGFGIGRGAAVLNFRTPSGFLTIDSYYLALALEYGVLGFIIFLCLFGAAIAYAGRAAFASSDAVSDGVSERVLFLPIGISLLNFIVIKSSIAQEDNHAILFALLGMLTALVFRACVRSESCHTEAKKMGQSVFVHRPQENFGPGAAQY